MLSETSYSADGVNDIAETVYASGEKNQVVTDISGNPVLSTYIDRNGASRTVSSAEYDHSGKIKKLVDNEQGVCYNYTYDTKGNLVGIIETDKVSGAVLSENSFVSDACERLTEKTFGAVGQTYRPIYEDDGYGYVYPDNEAIGISLDGKFTDKVTKDGLRSEERSLSGQMSCSTKISAIFQRPMPESRSRQRWLQRLPAMFSESMPILLPCAIPMTKPEIPKR